MFTNKYKEYIYKFLEKYLFIFNAIADGWRVKYKNKDQIVLCNNIDNIDNKLLDTDFFISKYKSKTFLKVC